MIKQLRLIKFGKKTINGRESCSFKCIQDDNEILSLGKIGKDKDYTEY